jgi:hypothetical protein
MANILKVEWNDAGCLAFASGFKGVLLSCPRCKEQLPRDADHRCGDRVTPVVKRGTKRGQQRAVDLKRTRNVAE